MESRSQVIVIAVIYVLAALSVAAGIPKILQMPQELGFLNAIGFSAIAVSIFGIVQFIGGVLLLWKKSRLPGAVVAGLAFLVSSLAIFASGNTKFGLISLLPIAILIVAIYYNLKGIKRAET